MRTGPVGWLNFEKLLYLPNIVVNCSTEHRDSAASVTVSGWDETHGSETRAAIWPSYEGDEDLDVRAKDAVTRTRLKSFRRTDPRAAIGARHWNTTTPTQQHIVD